MTTILSLVLSHDDDPWRTLEAAGQRATWAHPSRRPPEVDVIWYRGDARPDATRTATHLWNLARVPGRRRVTRQRLLDHLVEHGRGRTAQLHGDVLHVPVPDVIQATAVKLRLALEWAVAHRRFDYVWRTNSSTFTHLPTLIHLADALPRTGVYAGRPGGARVDGRPLPFASGTGMLMSRDVVEQMVASDALHTLRVDDVATSVACHNLGVSLVPLRRVDVTTLHDVAALTAHQLTGCAFVRCFSGARCRTTVEPPLMVALQAAYDALGADAADTTPHRTTP